MRNEELLEKIDGIRRASQLTSDDIDLIVKLLKEEPKKGRQTGPAIGQTYWIDPSVCVALLEYNADDYDLKVRKYRELYPEERFAEAELRARKLIVSVNKRRRELNEGEESEDGKFFIDFWSGLDVWGESKPEYSLWQSYPFGLFKDPADCIKCIHEFKDELEWFYKEYLPLMAELDDYDWAEAPGWGGEE